MHDALTEYKIKQLRSAVQDHEARIRTLEKLAAKITAAAAIGSILGGAVSTWIFSKF